ncbi:hypothetical protein QJS10_CPA02g00251 [Acorus calamus]|uniref:Uncharacterized protein n=1 Tax=Acorus calamus TaxID=4465 RepID=A0AAV9FC23_ACOCL|nr:hypothetical protein QJS10_CPA02g00251 [Acorus calamus]
MAATLLIGLSFLVVLSLVLLLLIDLFFSLYHNRRRPPTDDTASPTGADEEDPNPQPNQKPLHFARAHGVLRDPPKHLLLSAIDEEEAEQRRGRKPNLHFIGLVSPPADEHYVYVSNPIYDGETPFETPETSPSRVVVEVESPPLTAMKKLPPVEAAVGSCSGSVEGTTTSVAATSGSVTGANRVCDRKYLHEWDGTF